MATTLIALERQLQADGWWYSVANDRWSRLWGEEMQYCEIREDGRFERVYPVPKPVTIDESTVRVEDGQVFATGGSQKVVFSEVMDPNNFGATMADVGEEIGTLPPLRGEVWVEEQPYDRTIMPVLDNDEFYALRDQFAMHAMQALINNDRISDPKGMALRAYEYADAMMIAREMKR